MNAIMRLSNKIDTNTNKMESVSTKMTEIGQSMTEVKGDIVNIKKNQTQLRQEIDYIHSRHNELTSQMRTHIEQTVQASFETIMRHVFANQTPTTKPDSDKKRSKKPKVAPDLPQPVNLAIHNSFEALQEEDDEDDDNNMDEDDKQVDEEENTEMNTSVDSIPWCFSPSKNKDKKTTKARGSKSRGAKSS
jgi:chromosome segregation ATPase